MRYYSSSASAMQLTAGVSASATTVTVNTVAGLPVQYPYTLVLDYGTPLEEITQVTGAAGTTLTVTRGYDGTAAQAHSTGAQVRHGLIAGDLREAQEHMNRTDVHGVGTVVGALEEQTLDRKTLRPQGDWTALTLRQRSGSTAPLMAWLDAAGAQFARLTQAAFEYLSSGAAFLRITHTPDADSSLVWALLKSAQVGVDGKASTGWTGKFLRLLNPSDTEVFSVDSAGKVTSSSVQTGGAVSAGSLAVTGGSSLTGAVSTGGALSVGGAADVAGTLAVTGNITAPNIKSGAALQVAVSAPISGTTDSVGFVTVTHGFGFTPSLVLGVNTAPGSRWPAVFAFDSATATTVRLRMMVPQGGLADTMQFTVKLIGVA